MNTCIVNSNDQKEIWLFRFLNWCTSIHWSIWLVVAYGFLIPVVALNLPGVGGVGAADLLMPFSFAVVLFVARRGKIQMSHIALTLFLLVALLSLTQIRSKSDAIACTIRWVRLFGILAPFFFGLFIAVNKKLINHAITAWVFGGLFAVLVGVVLHALQIEVRAGQQRLWVDGGSFIRAGGLIGNSGAFGHMTATWAVISVISILHVWKHKFRHFMAAGLIVLAMYVVYVSSSRAAMMHMGVATIVAAFLIPVCRKTRQKLAAVATIGVFGIVTLMLLVQVAPLGEIGNKSKAVQSNLQRFIPGLSGDSSEFTSNRADNWPEYIEMMSDSILLGAGYKMGVRMHEESPDNSYLSVMLETGVIGFACMSLFVVSVLYRLILLYFAGDPYAVVMIPVCCGQLANCLTSDIYTFWITMPIVFLLLGLCTQPRTQLSPKEK